MSAHAAVLRRSLQQAIRRRDHADAEVLLERLTDLVPDDLDAQLFAVELRLGQGRLAEARALGEAAAERAPERAWAQELLGRVALRQREYPRALQAFAAAERLAPSPRVRLWLARAHLRLDHLDAAEPILRSLGAPARVDLAWVHERRGQIAEARRLVDQHLAEHPGDTFAQSARQRLAAAVLDRDELFEEVETLRALGEVVPAPLVKAALEQYLAAGRTADARALLDPHLPALSPKEATDWGWVAYRAVALDLAFELFSRAIGDRRADPKFLQAIEAAARACGREATLADLLERHAAAEPKLWGHIKKLRG